MRIFNSGDRTEVPLVSPDEVKVHIKATAAWEQNLNVAKKNRDDWSKEARKPFTGQLKTAKIAKLSVTDAEKQLLLEDPNNGDAKKLEARFRKELRIDDSEYVALLSQDDKQRLDELERSVQAIENRKLPELPTAFAFADFAPDPRESWFFERGDFMARNERMELGFLTVLTKGKTPDEYWSTAREVKLRDDSTQQRHAMADWITDIQHGAGTLLARVMVNRVMSRMALPFGIQGFTSCSGFQFFSKFVPGFLHECEHLGSAFVDSRFGAAIALADSLTDRHGLCQSGQFRRDTDHRA